MLIDVCALDEHYLVGDNFFRRQYQLSAFICVMIMAMTYMATTIMIWFLRLTRRLRMTHRLVTDFLPLHKVPLIVEVVVTITANKSYFIDCFTFYSKPFNQSLTKLIRIYSFLQ
jgi:hypothetical protein